MASINQLVSEIAYSPCEINIDNLIVIDKNGCKIEQNKDIARQIQLEKEQGVKQPVDDINNENAGKKFAQSTTARYGTKRDKKFIGGIYLLLCWV